MTYAPSSSGFIPCQPARAFLAHVAVLRLKSPTPASGDLFCPLLCSSCSNVRLVATAIALDPIMLLLLFVGDQLVVVSILALPSPLIQPGRDVAPDRL